MSGAASLTVERLRGVLDYDPKTGVFCWRQNRYRKRIGTVAGYRCSSGHLQIRIDGRAYLAHRLAWLHVYGRWPAEQLDHRDTVRTHNWLDNLREATHAQNQQNSRPKRKGVLKGVWLKDGKWATAIRVDGFRIHLGYFDTAEAAHVAYVAAASKHHGEFARAA